MPNKSFIRSILIFSFFTLAVSAQTGQPERRVTLGVVNGKATSLPKPEYPAAAKAVRASGTVNVQVTIDEKGEVMSAEATSGHPLLRHLAQRSLGMPVTAKPFRARVTRRAPEPPMTLAFAFDISGSMGWAEDVLASMAWSFSHASTYVKGRSASVLFGSKVHALVHPGRTPEKVREFNAHDGMEDFVGAFAALDGALNLVRGDGVRLLTVISDGYFGAAGQARGTQKAIDRFVRSGGQVLWIGQEGTHFPDKVIRVEINTREVAKVPDVVTAALTTALRRAA